MLLAHINKTIPDKLLLFILVIQLLILYLVFSEIDAFWWGYCKNLGPKKDFSQTFSIGHWNLNSLVAHNFTKVALLKAYFFAQRFDIFCISETYLNSSITEDDDSLLIPGYDLICSDHPSKNKRGGVTIYDKN